MVLFPLNDPLNEAWCTGEECVILISYITLPSAAMMKRVLLYISATSSSVQLNSTSASTKIRQTERQTFYMVRTWLVLVIAAWTQAEEGGLLDTWCLWLCHPSHFTPRLLQAVAADLHGCTLLQLSLSRLGYWQVAGANSAPSPVCTRSYTLHTGLKRETRQTTTTWHFHPLP